MEATSTSSKVGRGSTRDLLSTRSGAIAVAAGAAILAGILLYAFVQRYRDNQSASSASRTVFVAKSFIPQGSSSDVIGSEQLLARTSIRGNQAQAGAIADPSVLHGEVAVTNIYPGQQITAADFTSSQTVASDLTASERAISVPVDSAHGLTGFVHTGDHVDVLASYTGSSVGGRGSVTILMQDVLVLNAPTSGGGVVGGSNNGNILLRVSAHDATALAYAADNGKVWIVLRPPLGATQPTAASPSSETTTTETSGH
jgi:Flp pilus assembly protein CpaB